MSYRLKRSSTVRNKEETKAYLKFCDVEDLLVKEGLLKADEVSGFEKHPVGQGN